MASDLPKAGTEDAAHQNTEKRTQFESIGYLEKFSSFIERGTVVLDIGCGDGIPVDEYLVEQGFVVNGLDSSAKMVALAKNNVPEGFFEVKDALDLKEGEYCVNGVVSLHAISRIPHERYEDILTNIASFLPNGGAILVALGSGNWEATQDDIHAANFFWSHDGAESNEELVENAGFEICLDEINGSANEKHQVILALLV